MDHTQRFEFFDGSVASITRLTCCLSSGLYPIGHWPDLWSLRPQVIGVNIILRIGTKFLPALLEAISLILEELPSHLTEDQSSWSRTISSRHHVMISIYQKGRFNQCQARLIKILKYRAQ